MPLWSIASVDDEPEVLLESWAAYKVKLARYPEPSVHLTGYVIGGGGGRVTSAVQEIDAATRRVRTRSGRVYELRGRPGANLDAEYTWNRWVSIQDAEVLRDVTEDVLAQLVVPALPARPSPRSKRRKGL
jgi:hypothetical protein